MTRRIAISILVTVWLVLLFAGGIAYFVTRSVLLADLDASLQDQIAAMPTIERPGTPIRAIIKDTQGGGPTSRPAFSGAADVPPLDVISRSFTKLPDGSRLRTLTVKAFRHRDQPGDPLVPATVTFSGSTAQLDSLLSQLGLMLGIYGVAAGLATAGVAVVVARRALLPLRTTTQTIGEISERNLDRRIAVEKLPPELVPVGERLNEMLSRLERAFVQRKQFLADASHELRTPVAALVTTLEVTLHKNRTQQEYQRALESCLADSRVLHQLVAALMDQVRGEQFGAGQAAELAPVSVSAVLNHCADIATTLGASKGIQIERHLPADLVAISDELKLRSIATNLLSNAVEYTHGGGGGRVQVEVAILPATGAANSQMPPLPESVTASPRLLQLKVSDNGPGIAARDLGHLFEPFYRVDKVRSQAQQHLGLGLFLVREHVRSLGGDCRAESPNRQGVFADAGGGPGSVFIVELPMFIVATENPSLSAGRISDAAAILMKD